MLAESYRLLVVVNQSAPDAAHSLLDLGVRVELVTIKLWDNFGQEWCQLLSSLCGYGREAKCSTLKRQDKIQDYSRFN